MMNSLPSSLIYLRCVPLTLVQKRLSGEISYRKFPDKFVKTEIRISRALMGIFWAWTLYNFTYNYHMFFGHYLDPVPKNWPDEYLGIPPDEEGLAPEKEVVRRTKPRFSHPRLEYFSLHEIRRYYGEDGPFKM